MLALPRTVQGNWRTEYSSLCWTRENITQGKVDKDNGVGRGNKEDKGSRADRDNGEDKGSREDKDNGEDKGSKEVRELTVEINKRSMLKLEET